MTSDPRTWCEAALPALHAERRPEGAMEQVGARVGARVGAGGGPHMTPPCSDCSSAFCFLLMHPVRAAALLPAVLPPVVCCSVFRPLPCLSVCLSDLPHRFLLPASCTLCGLLLSFLLPAVLPTPVVCPALSDLLLRLQLPASCFLYGLLLHFPLPPPQLPV